MHQYKRAKKNTRFGRLKLLASGLLLAAVGILRIINGDQVLTHWTGQPLFSWGLIASGGICILLAVVPSSWIAKAITTSNGKAHSE